MADPEFFDARTAGWWVWGQCLWIGSGWCQSPGLPRGRAGESIDQKRRPHLTRDQGIQIDRKRPSASRNGESVGVHGKRFAAVGNGQGTGVHRRWQGGGAGGGSGVHAPSLTRQKPDLSGDSGASGRGIHTFDRTYGNQFDASAQGHGINAQLFEHRSGGLYDYLERLAVRLRRVRVCCGDWRRVLTPSVTTYVGVCGVFLDPPYKHDMRERCYSEDHDISADVRQWAIDNGDNPDFRIALCGYDGEHAMPASWECIGWKAHGGYSRSVRGVANRKRERIWFSPGCLKPNLFSSED